MSTHPYTGPEGRIDGIRDSENWAGYSPYVWKQLDHTYVK